MDDERFLSHELLKVHFLTTVYMYTKISVCDKKHFHYCSNKRDGAVSYFLTVGVITTPLDRLVSVTSGMLLNDVWVGKI